MFKLLNIWFQWKKRRRRSNFKTPKHLNILFAISIQTWLAVPHTAIECNINVKLKFPYKHKSHWMWYKRRRLRYTYTFIACTSGTWMRMGMRVCVCAHALCFILPDWSWISMRHCTFTLFWSKKSFFVHLLFLVSFEQIMKSHLIVISMMHSIVLWNEGRSI